MNIPAMLALLASILVPTFVLGYGWMFWMFLHYRHCRQHELLNCLAMAAEAQLPLAPALRAYLADRPHGSLRELWLGSLLCLLPFPGYYWLWHRPRSYERRVEWLVQQLEMGVPLGQALRVVPGVVSRDVVLAAAVGESTGQLGRCLRSITPRRFSLAWFDLLGPFGYPLPTLLITLLVIPSTLSFLVIVLLPRFQRIFDDFGVEFPALTQRLVEGADSFFGYPALGLLGLALMSALVATSPTMRWYFPGIGYLTRQNARRRVLHTLSLLLGAGKTVPESLGLLSSLALGGPLRRRLVDCLARVQHGEPFAESLLEVELLPLSHVPLVHAAERAGHLPWALAELAESLTNRMVRAIRRTLVAVFPACVIAVGALVAFVVIALFLPLVKLITELSG